MVVCFGTSLGPCLARGIASRSLSRTKCSFIGSELFAKARQRRRQCLGVSRAPFVRMSTMESNGVAGSTIGGVEGMENVVDVLEARGLIERVSGDGIGIREICAKPTVIYVGFDPTAESLHVGNLLGLVVLGWFQKLGHEVVALVGGATGRIGDPSGKSMERPLLGEEQLQRNLAGITKNVRAVLGDKVEVVDNMQWVGEFGLVEFLREVGKHARVGTMIAKESVKTRLESDEGLSFTEFTYQLLQGYDFMHLAEERGIRIQAGGSDQWGNIIAGIELGRKIKGKALYGLTFPLLTTTEGRKIGKSEGGGAAWLSADKLSPYGLYQYMLQTSDADVIKFLKMMTFLDLDEVDAMTEKMKATAYEPNSAQRLLASEITRMVHGESGLETALRATEVAKPGGKGELSIDALEAVSGEMPTVSLERAQVLGMSIPEVMVKVGLVKSKGEGRRLVNNSGGYLNNAKVESATQSVVEADLVGGKLMLLAAGKKNKLLVRIE
eukprot:Plantae.Rhodophyta-Hildenbrandia_rubra.ctg20985.p1 GENE.Plantae.Rhodophyta-Hildenbrandia_rubra.ctg20985~~Plantae.Rhodophyta-Hildenbrandia_rubra.ctg20985.p1  ORF type:complete len:496 (+),score=117.62 Plantae.Rhodophyta-Hildenbrandia_rubra.ctg20985:261-1748(+)